MMNDDYFMNFALLEAEKAYELGEVPVGAVIVYNNEIIAKGYNKKEGTNNALNHAEVVAISNACSYLNKWRLDKCTLYITMSPCLMCIGAINESRIGRIVCGFLSSSEQMFLLDSKKLTYGVQKEKCLLLMMKFFKNLRNNS